MVPFPHLKNSSLLDGPVTESGHDLVDPGMPVNAEHAYAGEIDLVDELIVFRVIEQELSGPRGSGRARAGVDEFAARRIATICALEGILEVRPLMNRFLRVRDAPETLGVVKTARENPLRVRGEAQTCDGALVSVSGNVRGHYLKILGLKGCCG